MDCSPPGSSIHGIFQARVLEWDAIAFSLLLTMFSSVQLLSRVRLFATSWIAACQASLSITNSWSSRKLMCIKSVMPSSHLILCRPLLLLAHVRSSLVSVIWPLHYCFPKKRTENKILGMKPQGNYVAKGKYPWTRPANDESHTFFLGWKRWKTRSWVFLIFL